MTDPTPAAEPERRPTADRAADSSAPPAPPRKRKGKRKKARDHRERRETARDLPLAIDVPFAGIVYTIARDDALNVETYELVEDGKYVTAVRAWLGPAQWAAFKEAHREPNGIVPMDALERFLNAVLKRVPSLGK